jgi:hypothetical protein
LSPPQARNPSSCLSHTTSWFQLAPVWSTNPIRI